MIQTLTRNTNRSTMPEKKGGRRPGIPQPTKRAHEKTPDPAAQDVMPVESSSAFDADWRELFEFRREVAFRLNQHGIIQQLTGALARIGVNEAFGVQKSWLDWGVSADRKRMELFLQHL